MDFLHLPATANVSISRLSTIAKKRSLEHGDYRNLHIICLASKRQGFGPEPKKEKTSTAKTSKERKQRKFVPVQPMTNTGQAPGLDKETQSKPGNILSDRQFMDRLEAVKRSALEQKKLEEKKLTQAIDYDAPIESEKSTIGLGTRVGVGIAVVVFGLVFAFGDFLPSGSLKSSKEIQVAEKKLTAEEKATLQTRLEQYEATLKTSPDDLSALEGAAVTSADLGEYKQASLLLEKLTKQRPEDYEAYRLLGEVKYELKDYDGSASAYKSSLSASSELNLEALRGLTNALLAAKKPDEAVQVLLSSAQQLNDVVETNGDMDKEPAKVDPIQVQLLLGKAYSDWGHVSDAVSVYDRLISKHPNDFRGYLAKGIILKENGKVGDAERMFIQARFFATDKAKALVDRYSRK